VKVLAIHGAGEGQVPGAAAELFGFALVSGSHIRNPPATTGSLNSLLRSAYTRRGPCRVGEIGLRQGGDRERIGREQRLSICRVYRQYIVGISWYIVFRLSQVLFIRCDDFPCQNVSVTPMNCGESIHGNFPRWVYNPLSRNILRLPGFQSNSVEQEETLGW
jgi:hypothetical protein